MPRNKTSSAPPPDWKAIAMEAFNALRLMNAHYDDMSKSNPGFLGKLVLQDYALLNEAFIASSNVLAKYKEVFGNTLANARKPVTEQVTP